MSGLRVRLQEPQPAHGPTSFAGLHNMVQTAAGGIPASEAQHLNLVDLLEHRPGSGLGQIQDAGANAVHMPAVLKHFSKGSNERRRG